MATQTPGNEHVDGPPLFHWCDGLRVGRSSNFTLQGRQYYVTTTLSYLWPTESVIICEQPQEQAPLLHSSSQTLFPPNKVTLSRLDCQLMLLCSGVLLGFASLILFLAKGETLLGFPHWVWGFFIGLLAFIWLALNHELQQMKAGSRRARALSDLVYSQGRTGSVSPLPRSTQGLNAFRPATTTPTPTGPQCPYCGVVIKGSIAFTRICTSCHRTLPVPDTF